MSARVQVSTLETVVLVSEIIGVKNTLLLCEALCGKHIYFPKINAITAALRDREIIKEIKKGRERNHEYRNKRYDAKKLAKKFNLTNKSSIYQKVNNFCALYREMIRQGRDVEIL